MAKPPDDEEKSRRQKAAGKAPGGGPASSKPPVEEDDEEDDEDDDDDEDEEGPVAFTLTDAFMAIGGVWRFCGSFLGAHRPGLALIGLGLLVETAFNVLMPYSLKILIDSVLEDGERSQLINMLIALGVAGLVTSVVSIFYERLNARITAAIVADIRARLFSHLHALPSSYFQRVRAGAILSRFSVDMASIEGTILYAGSWGVLPLLELFAGLALMFVLNWELALLAVLVLPIALIGPRFIAPRAVGASYELKRAEADTLASVHEQIGGFPVIRAFGLRRIATGWFSVRNAAVRSAMTRSTFLTTMVERSVTIAVLALHLIVFGVGAILTYDERISLGTFVTFESVFWEISYNVSHIMQFVPQLIESSGAARHMREFLDAPTGPQDRADAIQLDAIQREIAFENVSFAYEEGRPQLHDFNLAIPMGRKIAIVGPSGAGKSTVLSLLMRLQEPSEGRMTVDGVDAAAYTRDSLRAQMAVVFQDNILFQGTLAENIRLGKPDATQQEIIAAAKAAEIHKFIRSLPDGYDTVVGERGATLSGGERQRIAIARAVVRNPAILVLDEATSALDGGTEAAVNKTIRGVAAGRTVVFVTHRLASVVDMDEIVVMEGGRIVQRGSHAELSKVKGLYARLWRLQSNQGEKQGA